LRSDQFRSARRTLTLLYLATIAAIVAVLSAALYEFHARDVQGIERRETEGLQAAEDSRARLAEYLEHLGKSIITADLITIAAGGVLSYLLAARTLQPIKEAVESEQRFFADAAHDLRTPLAVMRSEAEVALRSASLDAEEARVVIVSSLEEISRMSAMVEQMLELAKSGASAQRAASAAQVVDLSELAGSTGARMALRARDRGIRLETEATGPVLIRGDAPALERAVYNVLENALAYTPRGGCVTVAARREGGEALLSVEDTGMGIPPEDLPHITEPFFRGDRARGAHSGGAGLGLTIVKTTMDEHGGSFHAESRPGSGTTIALRFPAL
jgi:two-component system sensor histidine kinase CiaH